MNSSFPFDNFSGPQLICPKCHQSTKSILKAMDGGSDVCNSCGCLFHKCANGNFKIGSPGFVISFLLEFIFLF